MSDSPQDHGAAGTLEAESGSRPHPTSLSERVRSLRLPDQAPPRRSAAILPWSLCVLLAGTSIGMGYLAFVRDRTEGTAVQSEPDSTPSASEPDATSAPVAVAAVGNVALESKGYIIPAHQILVSPKVSGMVTRLAIEEGNRVRKGDVLAELERTEYEADHAANEAILAAAGERLKELEQGARPKEIEQAKAELNEAEAQREQLQSELRRDTRLRAINAVAQAEFEQSESAYKAMDRRVERLRFAHDLMVEGPRKERIEAARAEVRQAEANLAKAKWRLDNCTVRAPVSGTILKKNAEEGNIVNPVAFNGSFSLCELADLADMEVELYIQERDVARVFVGQRCKVRAEAYAERAYDGVVARLMPIADRARGAIPVRVKLTIPAEEEGVYLKPEMGAIVTFMSKKE